MKDNLAVLGGAIAGGVVGYYGFFWLAQQGFYAMILPGALLGLGASMWPCRSIAVSVACGVMALALGLFTEWRFGPFMVDAGLGYFLTHFYQLQPVTLLMIGAGAFLGFWPPFRRIQGGRRW
jgi:hypothetical protein